MAMITRNTDKKAGVTLPKEFADHLVIIEHIGEAEVRIRKALAIPENEAWLWRNPTAAAKVRQGLIDAEAGDLVAGPDLDADAAASEVDEADRKGID